MAGLDVPLDFGVTEEHVLLRSEAQRFLAERCPPAEVRRWMEEPSGFDPTLWREIGRLGWVGLAFPEAHGGAGLGHLPLALLLDEMGRSLLPSPFFACLLAGFAFEHAGSAGQCERWLPSIASGESIASLALLEPGGAFEADALCTSAEPAEGGFVLRGRKIQVLAAPSANLLVVPCREPDGQLAFFVVEPPCPGLVIDPETGIDATRRSGRVTLEGVRVPADARLDGEGATALNEVLVRGAAALAAEMVGGAEGALLLTRDYAIQRVQFGRPIGSFQAVKHPIVDTLIGVELVRSLALAAGAGLDRTPAQAEPVVRMAKALAGDVFSDAVRRAVQLHGGYGFTWDCDIHLYFRRALWSRAVLGDGTHHRHRLAEQLFAE